MKLRYTIIYICLALMSAPALLGQSLEWRSGSGVADVLTEGVPTSSGLNAVYVARSTSGLSAAFTPASGNPAGVKWMRYSSLGGGYAEDVPARVDGPASVVGNPQGDMGYIVEDGTDRYYFWLVDYSRHPFSITDITENPEQECGQVALDVTGQGDEIAYYSINGRRMTLSRDIKLTYNTLEWDSEQTIYRPVVAEETLEYLHPTIHAMAPLCATSFTIEGDKFLQQWGLAEGVTSSEFQPRSVACHTDAVQAQREDADNEVKPSDGGATLGGSAPCEVNFKAEVTDAAIFREWQFARDSEFENITLRMSELEFDYSFIEEGTTYVRFYCANADASCEAYGDTYDISIGTSSLKCPNAFSPFNEDGVNDLWKVTYSSIISFECHIYNRRGKEMCSFTDPSQGWDGKYGGKFVPAGAYFYVIKAKGADGKNYNLSGDINIVDYKSTL